MTNDAYVKTFPAESVEATDSADPRQTAVVASPLGMLTLTTEADALTHLDWTEGAAPTLPDDPLLREARRQLDAYFAGDLKNFDLPLRPSGEPFERAVWQAMLNIPFGATETYGFIANLLEKPARAVGGACGRNPIPIIIPCHRVVGAGGKMTGYSGKGGVETKQQLLRHEGALLI